MNNKETLPEMAQHTGAVQLHDGGLHSGSLVEQSFARLSQNQMSNLVAKAGEEALRLEIKSREQNMDYIVGKKATEDHIDTFNMLDKKGTLVRQSVISDIKTGAGNMRIESKSGATCFVASVAYDDPNHPDVMFLRWFRDHVLSKTPHGLAFTAWYWRNGPMLSKVVGQSLFLRNAARMVIAGLVKVLRSRSWS